MLSNKKCFTNDGFTALELLMVIAIMGLLMVIVIAPLSKFRNNKLLDVGTENILSVLSKARASTLASKDSYQYGVHFETSLAAQYRGATYNSGDSSNEIYTLDPAIEISTITLTGGGSDLLFDRLTGKTSKDGTIIIRVKSDTSKFRTIMVKTTGIASVN